MSQDLAAEGPGAPPRVNGELVFDAPWQSRAFGIAAALADAGRIAWPDFQAALIGRVEAVDQAASAGGGVDQLTTGTPDGYWRCWLEALGDVTAAASDIDDSAWAARSEAFAQREPGHDHDHDHHDHAHDDGHDH